MLKKFVVGLVYGACTLAALTSCGSSKAGGTGEFATVYATATPSTSTIDSDVAKWVDVTGVAAPPCLTTSFATFTPDNINYLISSTPYSSPNTGQSSTVLTSDLIVSRVTLTLTPANSATPALPLLYQTQYLGSGQRVPAGGTATVPVRVVSNELKNFLFTEKGLNCDNPGTFTYRATVSFELLEVNTNRSATVTAPGFVQVNISDFIDAAAAP